MGSVEGCCAQLVQQLNAFKERWCATCVENVKLYKKIFELRKALNPGWLCCRQPVLLSGNELPMLQISTATAASNQCYTLALIRLCPIQAVLQLVMLNILRLAV